MNLGFRRGCAIEGANNIAQVCGNILGWAGSDFEVRLEVLKVLDAESLSLWPES